MDRLRPKRVEKRTSASDLQCRTWLRTSSRISGAESTVEWALLGAPASPAANDIIAPPTGDMIVGRACTILTQILINNRVAGTAFAPSAFSLGDQR